MAETSQETGRILMPVLALRGMTVFPSTSVINCFAFGSILFLSRAVKTARFLLTGQELRRRG